MDALEGGDLVLPNALCGTIPESQRPYGYQMHARSAAVSESQFRQVFDLLGLFGNNVGEGLAPAGEALAQVPLGSLPREPNSDPASLARIEGGFVAVLARSIRSDHAGRPGGLFLHAVFVSPGAAARIEGQSFGIARARLFLELSRWDRSDDLPLLRVNPRDIGPAPFAPCSPSHVDALRADLDCLLAGGVLVYRSSEPDPAAVEHLRLLHLGLPADARAKVGVLTFADELPRTSPFALTMRLRVSRHVSRTFAPGQADRLEGMSAPLLESRVRADHLQLCCRAWECGDLEALLAASRTGTGPASDAHDGAFERTP